MNPEKYLNRQLEQLRRSGFSYLFGPPEWKSWPPPVNKILLVAVIIPHAPGVLPSLAYTETFRADLPMVQAKGFFSHESLFAKKWCPIPELPQWVSTRDKRPDRDGSFLVLTKKNDVLLTDVCQALYGNLAFVCSLNIIVPGPPGVPPEMLHGDVRIEPSFWIEAPTCPEFEE
jgi:hypothetical protein